MKAKELPSQEFLRERFCYYPETGTLFWRGRLKSEFVDEHQWKVFETRYAGEKAGHKSHNKHGEPQCVHVRFRLNGKALLWPAHRIIFQFMGVPIPEGFEIDHKDTNPFNNAWDNLRLATRVQNGANQRVHKRRKYTHLPKDVSVKRKGFRAQIGFGGKQIGLGTFSTPEEAHAAYVAKAQELYGEYARAG